MWKHIYHSEQLSTITKLFQCCEQRPFSKQMLQCAITDSHPLETENLCINVSHDVHKPTAGDKHLQTPQCEFGCF